MAEDEEGAAPNPSPSSNSKQRDGAETDKASHSTPAPFKFSLPKAKQSGSATNNISQTKRPRDAGRKEFVTAVGEDGVETLEKGRGDSGPKIIPKQENSWRINKQTRFLPPGEVDLQSRPEERFEKETIEAGPEKNVQYGLTIMKRGDADESRDRSKHAPSVSLLDAEAQKLKEDLTELPDESELEDYDSMPIEEFGKAMLRGMGWHEGKPIGRSGTGPVTPMEYVPRPDRLGLGATPKAPKTPEAGSKRIPKPGESRGPKPDLVVPTGSDGRVRHVKSIDEKLVERAKEGVHVGKVMSILHGRHKGLQGEVLSVERMPPDSGHSDRASLRLSINEEVVSVRVKDLGELHSAIKNSSNGAQKQSLKQENVPKSETSNGISGPKKSRAEEGSRERQESTKSDDRKEAPHETAKSKSSSSSFTHWLIPHIRVRIVSKEFKRGKFYLKKATVLDLISPSVCDLMIDQSREILQGIDEDYLETVVPRKGGRVMIVFGKHKGKIGKVIDRNSEAQSAVIQLSESFDLLSISMDHVAEYEGEAEDFDS